MKKRLLIILMLVTTVVACKKQSNSTASNNKSSSPPPTPETTINDSACATNALTGTWIYDSTVVYTGGIIYTVTPSVYQTTDASYTLTLVPYGGGSANQYYQELFKTKSNGVSTAAFWYVNKYSMQTVGLLSLEGGSGGISGYIRQLNTHSLVLSQLSGDVKQGDYYYYHK